MKFDLTLTTCQGEKVSYNRAVGIEEIRLRMPDILDRATINQWNVIVRPKPPPVFLQLDDLDEAARDRVQSVSFMSLTTSAGNYQAWIALFGPTDRESVRRIKKQLGADLTASGATRIAGRLNFKDKYSPAFPRVAVCHVNPGLLVSIPQLSELGLVPVSEPVADAPVRRIRSRPGPTKWPSYERCITGAPLNHEGTSPVNEAACHAHQVQGTGTDAA